MSGKNYGLIEAAGVILFMTLFSLLGTYTFPLILFIFPMVFIVYGVRQGLIPSLFSMIIVSLAVAIVVDIYSGLFLFITFAPISMIIAYGIKSRRKPIEIIGYSALVFFITSLLISGYMGEVSGISIAGQLEASFKSMLNIQVELLKEMGLSNYELSKSKDLLENAYKTILLVLPTLLILLSMLISYINYLLSTLTLRKMGIGVVNVPRFSRLKLPNNIIAGIFVMFLGVIIIRYLKIPNYDAILVNLVVLISTLFFVQGLSIIDYFLLKMKMHFIFRLILLITMVFITPLVSIIALLGLADVFIDLRKTKKSN